MHDSDQLSLRIPNLVVQPPKRALPRVAVVVLHKPREETLRSQALLMPALEKEAPLIAVDRRFHEEDISQDRMWSDLHRGGCSCRS
jgi:hypothetical protein